MANQKIDFRSDKTDRMAQVEVLLPKMGESVAEATITSWLKSVGDTIESEESLVEIATDKVDSEIPSPTGGVLLEILVQEGEVAQVGQAIAIIGQEGNTVASKTQEPVSEEPQAEVKPNSGTHAVPVAAIASEEKIGKISDSGKFFSPLVRNIAQKEGIGVAELEAIPGTGQNGRITKKDILAYLPGRNSNGAAVTAPSQAKPIAKPAIKPTATATESKPAVPVAPAVSLNAGDEIEEMGRMRKLIADHMVRSKHTSPHVTSFVEADLTNLVMWRNSVKDQFLEREGQKITFTPLFIEAIIKAIKDYPGVNASVDGDMIIKRKNINIGMATALPNGNLIVPVIKNADMLNLTGLTKMVNDLASRARNNQLTHDEISGGTYTITNVGSFGNVMGTPIINQPQVAIMAMGIIQKKPAVIETPSGDSIGIRQMMFLSHSYDHRIVDGALGGMFVRRVADYLEQFDINREL